MPACQRKHINFDALERELRRNWENQGHASSCFYIGRTVARSEAVVEELEELGPLSVISAGGKLVLPLMGRRMLKTSGLSEPPQCLDDALARLGTKPEFVTLKPVAPREQSARDRTIGQRPFAILFPFARGGAPLQLESDTVLDVIGRQADRILGLRVGEASSYNEALSMGNSLQELLLDDLELEPPQILSV